MKKKTIKTKATDIVFLRKTLNEIGDLVLNKTWEKGLSQEEWEEMRGYIHCLVTSCVVGAEELELFNNKLQSILDQTNQITESSNDLEREVDYFWDLYA